MLNDWFLVLVQANGAWREVAADSPTVHQVFLEALGALLQAPLALGLVTSADYASRVIWPLRLQGHPLLQFETKAPRNWILRAVGVENVHMSLTPEVISAALID